MAIELVIEFPGGTLQEYEKTVKNLGMELNSDRNMPEGLISHIAYLEGDCLKVVDVWESRQGFDRFLRERLQPVLEKTGLPMPNVKQHELYDVVIGKRSRVLSGVR
jgi:hypothetical protein